MNKIKKIKKLFIKEFINPLRIYSRDYLVEDKQLTKKDAELFREMWNNGEISKILKTKFKYNKKNIKHKRTKIEILKFASILLFGKFNRCYGKTIYVKPFWLE